MQRVLSLERHKSRLSDSGVLSLCRRLDSSCAKNFASYMKRLIAAGARECIIDMSIVDSVDSSGFGALISAARKMDQAGGSVVVVCRKPSILRLFEIAGITAALPVVSTLSQARMLMKRPQCRLAS